MLPACDFPQVSLHCYVSLYLYREKFPLSTNSELEDDSYLSETRQTYPPHDIMINKFPRLKSDIVVRAIEAAQKKAEAPKSVEHISSYVPRPDKTFFFLLPQEPLIICAICRESRLQLSVRQKKDKDTTPAQLPCGHVFGRECLETWLKDNSHCPACRLDLKYPSCGHVLKPRTLDQENIRSIPPTIPLGGKIPSNCRDCCKKKGRRDKEFHGILDEVVELYRKEQTEQNHEQLLLEMENLKQFVAKAFEKRW